jgi:hypothetical protein
LGYLDLGEDTADNHCDKDELNNYDNEYLEICEYVAVADSNDDKGNEKLDQSRESSKPDNYFICTLKIQGQEITKYLNIMAAGKFTIY